MSNPRVHPSNDSGECDLRFAIRESHSLIRVPSEREKIGMETLEQTRELEDFTHSCAHQEFSTLLAAFTALPGYLAEESFEIEPRVRQRLREIRNDLCYSSHDDEAWQILKFRVQEGLLDLRAAYVTAGLLN